MDRILVTGATGFIGRTLVKKLDSEAGANVVAAVRHNADFPPSIKQVAVGDIDGKTDWMEALSGVNVVVHAAARAHAMNDDAQDPLSEYRRVNVDGTLCLARQAADAGVRRLIFISSIGVNGESTKGRPFTAEDAPCPTEPYALSKWEAEQGLKDISLQAALEIVVIRPPLVYGLNAPGNFGRLVYAVKRGRWLPLGAVHNRRTLVYLGNLIDLIMLCMWHKEAANQVFLAGDETDFSTTELLRFIGKVVGRPPRLLPVPVVLMYVGALLLGKARLVNKICGSLQVDISKNYDVLGWQPPISVENALLEMKEVGL